MRVRAVLAASTLATSILAGGWVACSGGGGAPSNDAGTGAVDGSSGSSSGVVGSSSGGGSGSSSGSVWGGDASVMGTPACTVDGGPLTPGAVPAFGTITGPAIQANICSGGAFAYLEYTQGSRTTPPQLLLIIDTSFSGDPASMVQFTEPPDATAGELTIMAGVDAAAPGTYPSTTSCGGGAFCAYLPLPPGIDCGDAATPVTCPPGCALEGPVSGPTCQPVTPEQCYSAQASGTCVYGTQSQYGSFTTTLTYLEPYGGADGGPGSRFIVHGSYVAQMPGDDASLGTATLKMEF